MKAVSGKRFCRLLESRGWQLKRVRGSRHIDVKMGIPARFSVPVHVGTLKRGLQRHLMKMAQGQDLGLVGALAAQVTARAVVRAVLRARPLPGYPCASDFL